VRPIPGGGTARIRLTVAINVYAVLNVSITLLAVVVVLKSEL
jgi:hypothetical protein